MFGYTHYVPILRWKRGEQVALRNMFHTDKAKMTPLIELVPKDFKPKKLGDIVDTDKVLHTKAEEIIKNWGPASFFVGLCHLDTTLFASSDLHPLEVLAQEVRSCQLSLFNTAGYLVPVTGLDRPATYQSAVATLAATDQRGACLRLFLKDIQRSNFKDDLDALLSVLNLQPEQIDLLIDYQVSNESNPSIAILLGRLPDLHRWRTFTAARGAFTIDLSDFKKTVSTCILEWTGEYGIAK